MLYTQPKRNIIIHHITVHSHQDRIRFWPKQFKRPLQDSGFVSLIKHPRQGHKTYITSSCCRSFQKHESILFPVVVVFKRYDYALKGDRSKIKNHHRPYREKWAKIRHTRQFLYAMFFPVCYQPTFDCGESTTVSVAINYPADCISDKSHEESQHVWQKLPNTSRANPCLLCPGSE